MKQLVKTVEKLLELHIAGDIHPSMHHSDKLINVIF